MYTKGIFSVEVQEGQSTKGFKRPQITTPRFPTIFPRRFSTATRQWPTASLSRGAGLNYYIFVVRASLLSRTRRVSRARLSRVSRVGINSRLHRNYSAALEIASLVSPALFPRRPFFVPNRAHRGGLIARAWRKNNLYMSYVPCRAVSCRAGRFVNSRVARPPASASHTL